MTCTRSSRLRTFLILLVLIVGPLQAQNVFACSMMDQVMHGECCCDGHKADPGCINSDCDAVAGSVPCCERSIQVVVDEETWKHTPIVIPAEARSSVDPPPVLLVSSYNEILPSLEHAAVRAAHIIPDVRHYDSDTYLVTQRLRI